MNRVSFFSLLLLLSCDALGAEAEESSRSFVVAIIEGVDTESDGKVDNYLIAQQLNPSGDIMDAGIVGTIQVENIMTSNVVEPNFPTVTVKSGMEALITLCLVKNNSEGGEELDSQVYSQYKLNFDGQLQRCGSIENRVSAVLNCVMSRPGDRSP